MRIASGTCSGCITGLSKMTSHIHSSHDLNRPEAKRFRVKLANLSIPKIDLIEVFVDLLEAENYEQQVGPQHDFTAGLTAYTLTLAAP
jgi:hypothetical protein